MIFINISTAVVTYGIHMSLRRIQMRKYTYLERCTYHHADIPVRTQLQESTKIILTQPKRMYIMYKSWGVWEYDTENHTEKSRNTEKALNHTEKLYKR